MPMKEGLEVSFKLDYTGSSYNMGRLVHDREIRSSPAKLKLSTNDVFQGNKIRFKIEVPDPSDMHVFEFIALVRQAITTWVTLQVHYSVKICEPGQLEGLAVGLLKAVKEKQSLFSCAENPSYLDVDSSQALYYYVLHPYCRIDTECLLVSVLTFRECFKKSTESDVTFHTLNFSNALRQALEICKANLDKNSTSLQAYDALIGNQITVLLAKVHAANKTKVEPIYKYLMEDTESYFSNYQDRKGQVIKTIQRLNIRSSKESKEINDLLIELFNSKELSKKDASKAWHYKYSSSYKFKYATFFFQDLLVDLANDDIRVALRNCWLLFNKTDKSQEVGCDILEAVLQKMLDDLGKIKLNIDLSGLNFYLLDDTSERRDINAKILLKVLESDINVGIESFFKYTEDLKFTNSNGSREMLIRWLKIILDPETGLAFSQNHIVLRWSAKKNLLSEDTCFMIQNRFLFRTRSRVYPDTRLMYICDVVENNLKNSSKPSISENYFNLLNQVIFLELKPQSFSDFHAHFFNYQDTEELLLESYKKLFVSREKLVDVLNSFLELPLNQDPEKRKEGNYRYFDSQLLLFLSPETTNSLITIETKIVVDFFASIKSHSIPFNDLLLLNVVKGNSSDQRGSKLKQENMKNLINKISTSSDEWANLVTNFDEIQSKVTEARKKSTYLKTKLELRHIRGFQDLIDVESFYQTLDDVLAENNFKPVNEVLREFQDIVDPSSTSLDIYEKEIYMNEFVYVILVALMIKLREKIMSKSNFEEAISNLGDEHWRDIFDTIQELASIESLDLIKRVVPFKISVHEFAAVQEKAVEVFEKMVEELATMKKISSEWSKLVHSLCIVRKRIKTETIERCFSANYTKFVTSECARQLKQIDEVKLKKFIFAHNLKNQEYYRYADKMVELTEFIKSNFKEKTFKLVKNEPQELKRMIEEWSNASKDYEINNDFLNFMMDFDYLMRKELSSKNFIDCLFELEEILKIFKEIELSKVDDLEEYADQLNDESTIQYFERGTMTLLKKIRESIELNGDMADIIRKLKDSCYKDRNFININQKLVSKRKEIKDFLQKFQVASKGDEIKKTFEISRILERSTIYFYQDAHFEPFKLLTIIKDEVGYKTDELKAYSINDIKKFLQNIDDFSSKILIGFQPGRLGRGKSEGDNKSSKIKVNQEEDVLKDVITEEKLRSLKVKADFLTSLSDSTESKFGVFSNMANMALISLETLSRLSTNYEVYDILKALKKLNFQGELQNESYHETLISVEIQNGRFDGINSLIEVVQNLKEECERVYKQVCIDQIHKFYFWSSFKAKHLSLIIKYASSYSCKVDEKNNYEKRVKLLFKHTDTEIPMEVAQLLPSKFSTIRSSAITYDQLETFNEILGISSMSSSQSQPSENGIKRSFKAVLYKQGDRVKALMSSCLVDSGRSIRSVLFCNPYTVDVDLNNFLLQSTNDPQARPYVIVDCHLLEVKMRQKILSELVNSLHREKINTNTNITLVVPHDHVSGISKEINDRYKDEFKIDYDWWKEESCVFKQQSKIKLITSDNAGLGKTHFIEQSAIKAGLELLVLNLSGSMTPEVLNSRLSPLFQRLTEETKNSDNLALRIKVDLTEGVENNFDYIDQLLFKICMLNKIEFEDTFLGFESMAAFYIELQNTLDNRLYNVEFISYLCKEESNSEICKRINLKSPFYTQESELKEIVGDATKFKNLNEIDFSLIQDHGLVEFLQLWFLLDNKLCDGGDPLLCYINPGHLKFIGIKAIVDSEMEKPGLDGDKIKLLSYLKSRLIEGKQISKEEFSSRKDLAEKQEQSIMMKLSNLKKNKILKSTGYSWYRILVSLAFNRRDLNTRANCTSIGEEVSDITSQEAWYMLLSEVRANFNSDFNDILIKIEKQKLDSGTYNEDFVTLAMEAIKYLLKDEFLMDSNFELADLNYYHIQTMLKLTQQFTQQLDKATNLDISAYIKKGRIYTEMENHVRLIANVRLMLTNRMISQNRSFAFEQILPMATLQRMHHSDMNQLKLTAEERQNYGYYQAISKLRVHNQIQSSCYFLKDGILKNIYNGSCQEEGELSRFLKHQTNSLIDLKKMSQTQYIQDILEAFTDIIAAKPTDSTGQLTEVDPKIVKIMNEISGKEKRFLITADNYLKMRLILQRAEVGIPSILLGESGCGKTFLIEFISEILFKDYLEMMTFHSGVSERELSELIKKCIKLANDNKDKRIWLFLDEINTTPLLTQIAELITERTIYFSDLVNIKLPANIVIVAACNPYKIRGDTRRINLASDTEQDKLIHKVYPLPENLISFCFNYGQLSNEDEQLMISAILQDSKVEIFQSKLNQLSNCISLAQRQLRRVENNESAASLRDVRRFVNLVKSFHVRGLWSPEDCILLAFHCCYCIRLDTKNESLEEDSKEEKNSHPSFASELSQHFASIEGIKNLFDKESTKILDEAKSLKCFNDDIAINKPLRENVFMILHSFLGNIPVFICGRPGTSKSVAVQIIDGIFNLDNEAKKKSTYFKNLPTASLVPIWGSIDTTAKHVEDIFKKVEKEAKKNSDKSHLYVIYFEEMGIADKNKNNPLKVLHPLLEPRLKDIVNNVCFVGLSNSLLDAAKLNRMLIIPRKEMEADDLTDTIKNYKIDESLKNFHKSDYERMNFVVDISEALVQSYINFRKIEQNNPENRNFHGPRDFYSACKWINAHIKRELLVNTNSTTTLADRVLSFLSLVIEKNFSGRELRQEGSNAGEVLSKNCSYAFKLELFSILTGKSKSDIEYSETDKDCQIYRKILDRKNSTTDMISLNLNDQDARHLMVFVEGSFYIDNVVEAIKQHQISKGIKKSNIIDLNNDKQSITNLINDYNSYVYEGFTVIMRNMDALYPSLLDLFNQRYTETKIKIEKGHKQGEKNKDESLKKEEEMGDGKDDVAEKQNKVDSTEQLYDGGLDTDMIIMSEDEDENKSVDKEVKDKVERHCQISHGNTIHDVVVNPKFKCIIIMDKPTDDDFVDLNLLEEKWPTALLNRFEKHLLTQEDLLDEDSYMKIKSCFYQLETNSVNPIQYVHNWSKSLLRSIVAKDNKLKKVVFPKTNIRKFIESQVYNRDHFQNQEFYSVR